MVKKRHSLSWLENSSAANGTLTQGRRSVSFFGLFGRNVDTRRTHLPIELDTIATM